MQGKIGLLSQCNEYWKSEVSNLELLSRFLRVLVCLSEQMLVLTGEEDGRTFSLSWH